MSRRRRIALSLVTATILGASAACIVAGKEIWPFSDYPMYRRLPEQPFTAQLRLYGVDAKGEFPILDPRSLAPLDRSQINHGWPTDTDAALADCHRRYRENVGRPLDALRLYRVRFRLEQGARNRDRPDERELLGEYRP